MIPTVRIISINNINWWDFTLDTDFVLREVGTELCVGCISNFDDCQSSELSVNIPFPLVVYIFI